MIIKDRHRVLYRGLVPIAIAFTNLYCIPDLMDWFKDSDVAWTNHLWPFIFVGGSMLVHPFMLIGMRVQCSTFAKTEKLKYLTGNTMSCAHYINKTAGVRGFYQGFLPSLFIYSLLSYEPLAEAFHNSIRVIKREQLEIRHDNDYKNQ